MHNEHAVWTDEVACRSLSINVMPLHPLALPQLSVYGEYSGCCCQRVRDSLGMDKDSSPKDLHTECLSK